MTKRDMAFDVAALILIYFLCVLTFSTTLNFLNINNKMVLVQIVSLLTVFVGYMYISTKTKDLTKKLVVTVIAGGLLLLIPFIMGRTYDLSSDGNAYHKPAIGYLKNGWNPMYQSSDDFISYNRDVPKNNAGIWIDHYPKASWTIAAAMYATTNNIESGKALSVLLIISLLIISYIYFSKNKLKKWQALILSIFLALNPISLAQLFTYYVDGIMGILLSIEVLLLLMINEKGLKNCKKLWLLLLCTIVLLCNIKFTGVLFSGLFVLPFYVYWLYKANKDKQFAMIFKNLTIMFAAFYLFTVLFIGCSTYVKNFADHGNPLYPLMGKGKVDIITTMQPKSFEHYSSIEKLLVSTFSRSDNISYISGLAPVLKIPFSVKASEFTNYSVPDLRIAGFGVLFSGIFTISVLSLIILAIYQFKKNKKTFEILCVVIGGIIISTVALGESWWARYAPQIYFVVIISLYLLFYYINNSKNIWLKRLAFTSLIIMTLSLLANNGSFAYFRYKDVEMYSQLRDQIEELKNSESNKLVISNSSETGIYYNLHDYKIRYEIINIANDETNFRYSYMWRVKVK